MNETRKLIQRLRADNGCPWDRKQTPVSMVRYLIEESYELQEAIHGGDPAEMADELGDTWFQMVFLIHLLEEAHGLSFPEVTRANQRKMIRRHPHVFGEETADTVDEVKTHWARIKEEEKAEAPASLLDTVTSGTPPLMRARDVSKVTAEAGFDWDDMDGVMEKVHEEWGEFTEALASGDKQAASLEFGDLLFTLVNVARFAGIDADAALSSSVAKFEKRYRLMEQLLATEGERPDRSRSSRVDAMWDRAKELNDGAGNAPNT
ncbi:nucleoside triphosphate pyrophosphohydrolase [Desulfoluna spongiiphila]|uniref:Tetrapyrrole methylase family protein / MazG family protein/ATP diphosphatase n=1 Tax=Desulfoluna spongiiphila TaxID=419481 RepID=A0A1G5IBJ2_9BACT|nr:nucleoside triphosphate pyrophosphohydrolase [Desulfoluna spongiiphila]SCY72989.1 tetrapyrrole methylase family protein / MazG family protein/ATP diphosphatase [Desulfoluna spongiiphila]VVS93146.1 ntp pyrophosphohydrolase mazg [Desulfoluna spongiiphila]